MIKDNNIYTWSLINNPKIIDEWDSEKNGDIKLSNFSYGSNKKVWWKCKNNHSWEAVINNRCRLNRGCPYCSHKKAIIGSNDFSITNKELLDEWDFEKNEIKPSALLPNSNKDVWWKCSKGHSFKQSVYNRTSKHSKCPYCLNQKVLKGYNDLETTNPELLKEWDYDKNVISPTEVTSGSGKYAYWKCDKGHSYKSIINNKNKGFGCPYCSSQKVLKGFNDLETTNPDVIKYWDFKKNNILPSNISSGSHKLIWWVCKNKHEYQMPVCNKVKGNSCPICNKRLKSSFPELAIYYYIKMFFDDAVSGYKNEDILGGHMEIDIYIPSKKIGIEYDGKIFHDKDTLSKDNRKYNLCKKNGIKLIRICEYEKSNIFRLSDKKIEILPQDPEWLNYAINNVLYELGIVFEPDIEKDKNKILSLMEKRNSNLVEAFPNVAKEWCYEKNNPLLPEHVSPFSDKNVWWKCDKCGNEWATKIYRRTKLGSGCPECLKLQLPKYAKQNLMNARPDVVKYWDYDKNIIHPENIGFSSSKTIQFKCSNCGYEWDEKLSILTKRKKYICIKCKSK